MNKRTKDIVVAMLAVGAAAVSLCFAFAGRSQKINLDPYQVLGAVTAEETAKLLGNQGQVLVMVPDTGANKNPSVEAETSAFQQALKRQKGMAVITERIQVNPMLMMATGGGVPVDQLFKALESHANIGAVVLFFGFPQLGDPELEALKKYGVKTVVASSFRPAYKRLMERQALHLVIASRRDQPPPGAPTPRTLRERFDQDFTIITPADAARLP